MPKIIDLTNQHFDRLTVVTKHPENDKFGAVQWKCDCSCGGAVIVPTSQLTSHKTRSCGCLNREAVKAANTKHGMSRSLEYSSWKSIRERCYDERHPQYADYGGRGITMCDEWKDDFMAFYNDMGPRPSKDHSIDRKDVNGNYCKENCRWATSTEQANNRRNSRFYLHDGVSRTLASWCRELNLKYSVVWERLELGWTFEKAITEPINDRKKDGIHS